MPKEQIKLQRVKLDLKKIVNKKISRAWKGYGSAVFLELGNLHNELAWEKGGKPITSSTGEWTLSSDGAWKLVKDNNVLLDAEEASSEAIKDAINNIEGLTITSIELTETLGLQLSNKDKIIFYKAEYGFFTLVSNEKRMITYKDNLPYIQQVSL